LEQIRRSRHLVEKWLKQVATASLDDRHLDWRAGEPVNNLEPAEPGADHDHVMSACHSVPDDQQRLLVAGSARKMSLARPGAGNPLTDRKF
jgi:hypothetical protein